jgi:ADP-ribose pyrophosphatase YjhB (NUDIX family)
MEKVLNVFLYNHRLKFNEIEKKLKIKSNKLAYYLKKLEKRGKISKEGDYYKLNEEDLIPYLSDKKAVLPIILIALNKKGKVFFYQREKRPFSGKLSLPGGRMVVGESFQQATERIMRKFGIRAKFKKINSIALEHVKKQEKTIHSFLLVFVSAETSQNIEYINFLKNKRKIIESDYWLVKNRLAQKLEIEKLVSKT